MYILKVLNINCNLFKYQQKYLCYLVLQIGSDVVLQAIKKTCFLVP